VPERERRECEQVLAASVIRAWTLGWARPSLAALASNRSPTCSASGWATPVRTAAAAGSALPRGTTAGPSRRKWTRHHYQDEPSSTAPAAAFRPACASAGPRPARGCANAATPPSRSTQIRETLLLPDPGVGTPGLDQVIDLPGSRPLARTPPSRRRTEPGRPGAALPARGRTTRSAAWVFLREQGVHSSLISQWRWARDGDLVEGTAPGVSRWGGPRRSRPGRMGRGAHDQGKCLASVSTMCRVPRTLAQLMDRRRPDPRPRGRCDPRGGGRARELPGPTPARTVRSRRRSWPDRSVSTGSAGRARRSWGGDDVHGGRGPAGGPGGDPLARTPEGLRRQPVLARRGSRPRGTPGAPRTVRDRQHPAPGHTGPTDPRVDQRTRGPAPAGPRRRATGPQLLDTFRCRSPRSCSRPVVVLVRDAVGRVGSPSVPPPPSVPAARRCPRRHGRRPRAAGGTRSPA
jgi:hypothetical protein